MQPCSHANHVSHVQTRTITVTTTATTYNVTTSYTTTTVATSTFNETFYTATATTYLACATNNLLGPRIQDATYISNVRHQPAVDAAFANSSSPYNCCTLCQDAIDACDFAYFDTLAATNQCAMYSAKPAKGATVGMCSHASAGYFNSTKGTAHRWVVSNGPCGQLKDGAKL